METQFEIIVCRNVLIWCRKKGQFLCCCHSVFLKKLHKGFSDVINNLQPSFVLAVGNVLFNFYEDGWPDLCQDNQQVLFLTRKLTNRTHLIEMPLKPSKRTEHGWRRKGISVSTGLTLFAQMLIVLWKFRVDLIRCLNRCPTFLSVFCPFYGWMLRQMRCKAETKTGLTFLRGRTKN